MRASLFAFLAFCVWVATPSLAKGERERIPDALSAKLSAHKLAARDQPIAVGTPAPRFSGLAPASAAGAHEPVHAISDRNSFGIAHAPTAIVFYRGHW